MKLMSHLTKLLAIFLLVVTVTALPAPTSPINTVVKSQCHPGCQPMYSRCLSRNHNVDFCREYACEYYGVNCTSCQACDLNIDSTDFISARPPALPGTTPSTVFKTKRGRNKKSAPSNCIVICTHAHCDLLCNNPRIVQSSFANTNNVNNNDITTNTANDLNTTALLASIDLQSDKIGIPLTPGTDMVVLGQEVDGQFKKCAWFCNSDTVSCKEKCWNEDEAEVVAVADGEYVEDKAVEGSVECEIVEKNDVGQLLVCRPPAATKVWDDGAEDGQEYKVMHEMHCTIFWLDHKPHLVCREL